jgi:hypothetical protein
MSSHQHPIIRAAYLDQGRRYPVGLDIKGTDNPSNALMKALGWVLHHRHCYRMMGLTGSPYSNTNYWTHRLSIAPMMTPVAGPLRPSSFILYIHIVRTFDWEGVLVQYCFISSPAYAVPYATTSIVYACVYPTIRIYIHVLA